LVRNVILYPNVVIVLIKLLVCACIVMDPTEDEGADQPNWDKEPRLRSKRNRVRPKWRNDYV